MNVNVVGSGPLFPTNHNGLEDILPSIGTAPRKSKDAQSSTTDSKASFSTKENVMYNMLIPSRAHKAACLVRRLHNT